MIRYYIVDAFTDELYRGNQAGVCILEKPLKDEDMQKIAFENNLSETAFVLKNKDNYKIRWFTPKDEIDLCGHATLASAFVIANFIEKDINKIVFSSGSGEIEVNKDNDIFTMFLPIRKPHKIDITKEITDSLSLNPVEVLSSRDLIAVLKSEEDVKNYKPQYDKLKNLLKNNLGVVITAKGKNEDFVSRYFCPELDSEDPVTGSSHCSLAPYWSEKLNKKIMTASQISERGGKLYIEVLDKSISVSGKAVLFMNGIINK